MVFGKKNGRGRKKLGEREDRTEERSQSDTSRGQTLPRLISIILLIIVNAFAYFIRPIYCK
jgi:hypothetical protein